MQPFCKTQVLVLFLFMRIQTADDQYTFNESVLSLGAFGTLYFIIPNL